MDFTRLFAGGAIVSFIVASWDKIKEFCWRIVSLLIQQVEIPSQEVHDALVSYLVDNFKRSPTYDRVYGATHENLRVGRYGLIPYELFGQRSIVFWKGKIPFFFGLKEGVTTTNQDQYRGRYQEQDSKSSTITFIRGTIDIDDIILKACESRNNMMWRVATDDKEAEKRFSVYHLPNKKNSDDEHQPTSDGFPWYQQSSYRLIGFSSMELGKAPIANGKALDNLIFPDKIKLLIKEVERWSKSKDWYRSKFIPWKRGWLLYGPPGTGKTALARAFAEDLDLPIYVYNLAQMDNKTLMKTWSKMQINTPCIALMEDIDNIFHGRENVSRRLPSYSFSSQIDDNDDDNDDDNSKDGSTLFSPLTFDCLLNCLDGVEKSDGVFTIFTTNDLTKVDPALGVPKKSTLSGETEFISTRPGRIDKAIELTFMEPREMKIMAARILEGYENELEKMLDYIDQSKEANIQETPAQFQERCGQIALECYWKQQEENQRATANSIQTTKVYQSLN